MKHKLFSKSLLMASLLLATSCSDFLTEDPKGKLTPDNFYTNQDEINLAVYALYSKYRLIKLTQTRLFHCAKAMMLPLLQVPTKLLIFLPTLMKHRPTRKVWNGLGNVCITSSLQPMTLSTRQEKRI